MKAMEVMEARSADAIPTGERWQYEPKWDGFRCLLVRDSDKVDLYSKSGQKLDRYFPELVESALSLPESSFALDGEIVVPLDGQFSFDDLLQRIHPATSRVKKLAAATPALFLAFDLLAMAESNLSKQPLAKRRPLLEKSYCSRVSEVRTLTPFAGEPEVEGRAALACARRRRKRWRHREASRYALPSRQSRGYAEGKAP